MIDDASTQSKDTLSVDLRPISGLFKPGDPLDAKAATMFDAARSAFARVYQAVVAASGARAGLYQVL
jgi:hypothetical protein